MAKKKTAKSTRTKAASSGSKKTTKKKAATKKVTKKKVVKKVAKKSPAKKVTKKKAATKKATTKKKTTKKVAKKKVTKKKVAKKAPAKKTPTKKAPAKKTPVKKSVKKSAAKPASRLNGAAPDPLQEATEKEWTVAQLKRVKTGLKKKDLDGYLKELLDKRAEIIGNVRGMEIERNASLGDIAHMPLHMADVGSDNFEQEFTLGLMESERERLRDIEEAILRMREGYYGVCLESGRPIQRMRLEFAPWAKYCIDVARAKEKRGW